MIEIKVKQYNSAFTDEGTLDTDGADINTIFQLSDVREPEQRSTDYIKTFTLPGTKRNNRIFQQIYELGFQSLYFDPTKKIEAQVIVNGTQYFIGNLQVNKVNRLDSGFIDSYEVTIYGKVGSFFNDIRDINLKDMVDLSDFNHTYTGNNIIASWGLKTPNQFPTISSPKPNGFIFQKGQKVPFQYGNGYVYPLIWRGQTDKSTWRTQDFNPAIYVKTYVDRIIKGAGYKYKSDFFNSEYFRKLIIPGDSMIDSNNGAANIELTDDQTKVYEFEVGSQLGQLVVTADTTSGRTWGAGDTLQIKFDNDTTLPCKDPGNQYETLAGTFTVGKTGEYKWATDIKLQMRFEPSLSKFPNDMKIVGASSWPAEVYIKEIGTPNIIASKKFNWSFAGVFDTWKDWSFWTFDYVNTENISLSYSGPLQAGKKFGIYYTHNVPGGNYKYKTITDVGITNPPENCPVKIFMAPGQIVNSLLVTSSKSIMSYTNKIVLDGDTMDLNWFIPDMKAGDLINEINKLFNLYWLPLDDETFLIEPREDFYASKRNIKDWTGKVDEAITRTIQPLYDLNYKKYSYSYSSDDDYYNKDYEDTYKNVYSSKSVEIEADFITDEASYESKFAASPLVLINSTDKHMTTFVKDDGGKWVYQKPKTRILFYGGLKDTNSIWYVQNPYTLKKTTIYAEYPYAGHIDDPINPRHDLSWGWPRKYYFLYQKATTNTLFNEFWLNNIEEITDINSHLLTLTAVISDQDIATFDIRDIIQINGVYYRVNKLTHNPVSGIAEIELFKARDTQPIKSQNGGSGATWPTPPPGGPDIPNGGGVETSTAFVTTIPKTNAAGGTVRPYWGVSQNEVGETPLSGGDWNIAEAQSINYGTTLYGTNENALRGKAKNWGDVIPTQTYSDVANKDFNQNFYSRQGNNIINGSMNIVHPSASLVRVSGTSNIIHADTSNINIQGNGNIVMTGLQNVSVIGDNQIVMKSNYSYVNGIEIVGGVSARKITRIKSPTNAVGNEFKDGTSVELMVGGKNSTKAQKIIRGGQDSV
jgi:hypothetical protein